MAKLLNDGEVINALMASRTRSEAAELLGVSRQTLYNYMRADGFSEKLKAVQEAQDEELARIRETATAEAISCLVRIVTERDNVFSSVTTRDRIEAAKVLLGIGDTRN